MATWSDLKTKLEDDLDMHSWDFVSEDEALGYANEALREAVHELQKLGAQDDYYATSTTIPLVVGQKEYDLPSDIFATKIRHIQFESSADQYPLKRIKSYRDLHYVDATDRYRYLILNGSEGFKIEIYPTPQAEGTLYVYYLRNAKELEDETTVLDIPQAKNFLLQHVKCRIYEKEGNPNLSLAKGDLEREREIMISTLVTMIPDGDYEMNVDETIKLYQEMA